MVQIPYAESQGSQLCGFEYNQYANPYLHQDVTEIHAVSIEQQKFW